MPKISVEITPRMAELLQAGVVTITTAWYSSGSETYGRVTQPHPKLGVYPHESYVLDELEPLLEKVRVQSIERPTPTGSVTTPVRGGVKVDCVGAQKVPNAITVNGVRNALPADSLVWKDLRYLGDDQLNRRLISIGKEMGPDKAVSRISCVPSLSLTHPQPTLYGWWKAATTEQRFTLVSVSKKIGAAPRSEDEKRNLLARLGVGQYPFRGTDMQIQEMQEEEVEEEDEALGLEIDFDDLNI